MSKLTIKDIAKKAGVAISTASYALNNSDKVSAKTKEKVLKVAEEYNFTLNGAARDLKKVKKDIIGIFVPSAVGPYYSEIIHGIQEFAHNKGFSVIIVSDHKNNSTAVKFLTEGRVDGAIIMAPSISNDVILKASKKFPLVLLDRFFVDENIYNILLNNDKGMFEVLKHLDKIGAKEICVLTGEDSYDSNQRKNSIEQHRRNFDFEKITYIQGKFTKESGYEAARENFSSEKLPDAIISFNDEMAIGLINYFDEIKVKIPEEISIIGFDDIEIGRYITPKLSTVSYSKTKLGEWAAETLIKVLEGEEDFSKVTLVETSLVLRESCKL